MRRWLARVAWLGAICAALAVLAAGALAWRLAAGPVPLPWLTARLERALAADDPAVAVRIGATEVAWDSRGHDVDLRVRDVLVLLHGAPLARLPAAILTMAARPLLSGRLVLRALELPGPHLTLHQGAADAWEVGVASDGGDTDAVGKALAAAATAAPGGPLAALARVQITGARIDAEPRAGGHPWRLDDVALTLRRVPEAIVLAGGGALVIAETTRRIGIDGRLELAGERSFRLAATGGRFTLAQAMDLWPRGVGEDVRRWMAHRLRGGQVRDAELDVDGSLVGAAAGVRLKTVQARIAFSDLEVRPVDGAPAIAEVAGRAVLGRSRCRFEIARGRIGDLEVVHARTELADLASKAPSLAVRGAVRGPLAQALATTARYTRTTLDSFAATGRAEATLDLAWRLGRGRAQPVRIAASGALREVTVADVGGGHPLAGGTFAFDLAGKALAVHGGARIAGVPIELSSTETLGEPVRQIEAHGRLTSSDRAALGLDLRPWVEGPTPVRATIAMRGKSLSARVSADLREVTLAAPQAGIAKPAGIPGTAAATVIASGGRITRIEGASLTYGATALRGDADLDAGGSLAALRLDGILGPAGDRPAPVGVAVELAPKTGAQALAASADSVDLLFDALRMTADATGGRMRFDGTIGSPPDRMLEGQIEASDFQMTRAPLLARLLGLMSLRGLAETFGSGGLPVTSLRARLRHRGSELAVDDGVLESPLLAMRFAGVADVTTGALEFRGSLAPSYYGLNRLPARVPVLGRVLTGSREQGIQAFAFTVRGAASDPKVRVDPLSSLSPGAVRDLLRHLPRPALPSPLR